jgi:hypothetical protein
MKNEVIVKDHRIQKLIPQILIGHKEAIFRALDPRQYQKLVISRKDTIPPAWYQPGDLKWSGGLIFQREKKIELISTLNRRKLTPVQIESILKRNRLFNWILTLGCLITHLFQGRFYLPTELWKFEESQFECQFSTNNFLPGKIFLTYLLNKTEGQRVELNQIFRIIPKGLLGTAYWFLVSPLFNLASNKALKTIMNTLGENSIENWSDAAA